MQSTQRPSHLAPRITKLIIDSAGRDMLSFPSSSSYSITLPDNINEVRQLQLVASWFPFNAYQINQMNASFDVAINGATSQVSLELPHGDYTPTSIAAALQTILRTVHPDFDVATNSTTGKLNITNVTVSFALGFTVAASAASPLGFSLANYVSAFNGSTNAITAPYKLDLDDYNRYVVLRIDGFEDVISNNDAIHRAFGILYRHKMQAGIDHEITTECEPVLSRLARLSIVVLDKYGLPYNHQNSNHVFTLTVTHDRVRMNW